jgi:hypothetical protein
MFPLIARWVPGLGVVFAVLVVIAAWLESDRPGKDASDGEWTAYYADSANRQMEEVAFFLIGLAGLCFLQFLGSLRGALARAEGEPTRITAAAISSGVAFIAIAIAGHAIGTAVAWAVTWYGDDYAVDPDTARLLVSLNYLFYVMSLFAAAGLALATATVALWMRAFPAWLGWFSVLATIAGVLGIWGITGFVVLAWIVVLSAYLVWPRPTPAAPPQP